MQRQDKATTEKHAKILREMVKRPENKVCADCKRNDPRWASWNIGVFLCIRCSGVHRSMGTHISKVKSVDLDTWSVEQLQSIQRWGNHRANLYWEAHLRQGHAPPEHKIDSFIRSKYELRRWAMEGPPPADPSSLENQTGVAAETVVEQQAIAPPVHSPSSHPRKDVHSAQHSQRKRHVLHSLAVGSSSQPSMPQAIVTVQPSAKSVPAEAPAPAPAPVVNDLFSLDFHSPPQPAPAQSGLATDATGPKKSAKDDIMSLFTPAQPQSQTSFATQAAPASAGNSFSGMNNTSSLWGTPQSSAPLAGSIAQASTTNSWRAQSQTGWSAPAYSAPPTNVWGSGLETGTGTGTGLVAPAVPLTTASSAGIFSSADVWGTPSDASQKSDLFAKPTTTAKDDAFGDIWGGFK